MKNKKKLLQTGLLVVALTAFGGLAYVLPAAADPTQIQVTIEQDSPIITSVSPDSGPTEGGTEITITGDNFNNDINVIVGGRYCTNIVVISKTKLTCKTPAHDAGLVDITVITNVGSATLTGAFTYIAPILPPPLPPNTGLFRIGDKLVTSHEVIIVGILAVMVAMALILGLRHSHKSSKSSQKSR